MFNYQKVRLYLRPIKAAVSSLNQYVKQGIKCIKVDISRNWLFGG